MSNQSEQNEIKEVINFKKEKQQSQKRKEKINQQISKNRMNVVNTIFSLSNNDGVMQKKGSLDSMSLINNFSNLNEANKQQSQDETQQSQEMIDNFIKSYLTITSKQISKLIQLLSFDQITINIQKFPSNVIQFCLNSLLIPTPSCKKCFKPMKLGKHQDYQENCVWRCYTKVCDKPRVSLYFQHKVFSQFRCSLVVLIKLFLQYLPSQSLVPDIKRDLNLDETTITKARNIWHDIIRYHYQKIYSNILLGKNTEVVEADEACFRRKYNRGRILRRNQWIFGATERGEGFSRTILIPVANRDCNTLGTLIKQFVSTNCALLLTDKWRGYSKLNSLGFEHHQVNHSTNFVAQNENNNEDLNNKKKYQIIKGHLIHTQSIENKWNYIKQRLRRLKGKRKNYINDIFASLFYLANKDNLERKSMELLIEYINDKEDQQQINEINFEKLTISNNEEQKGDFEEQLTIQKTEDECQVNEKELYGDEEDNHYDFESEDSNGIEAYENNSYEDDQR